MYAFIAATLFLASCGGDDETDPVAPSITVTTAAPTSIAVSTEFSFVVDVRQGDEKLQYITIREDGTELVASRVKVNGTAVTATDKYEVKDNAILTITILSNSKAGKSLYAVAAVDKKDRTAGIEFNVETVSTTSNAVPKLYANTATIADAANYGSFYSSTKNSTYITGGAVAVLDDLDFALTELSGKYSIVRPQDQTMSASANADKIKAGTATTVFVASDLDVSTVTVAELKAASATATSVQIESGKTYFFYNSKTGVRALVSITSIDTTDKKIAFSIKYIK